MLTSGQTPLTTLNTPCACASRRIAAPPAVRCVGVAGPLPSPTPSLRCLRRARRLCPRTPGTTIWSAAPQPQHLATLAAGGGKGEAGGQLAVCVRLGQ